MKSIEELRLEIDEVDWQLAELFEKRMKIVEGIAKYKQSIGMEVLDSSREKQVIEKNVARIEDENLKKYYEVFQYDMMDVSKEYQKDILGIGEKVGYQGVEGAFSHSALNKIFTGVEEQSFKTFEDLFKGVANGDVKYGVLPIENSYTGEIGEVFDLLRRYDLNIVKNYNLKIEQNLLGVGEIDDIEEVYSHPQGFLQSEKFLNGRGWKEIPLENTAVSAKFVSEEKDCSKAAIGSSDTAKLYGLKILADKINTNNSNTTRFIVISKEDLVDGDRFSLLLTTGHQKGELARVLNIIDRYGYNMENLKSRPLKDVPWEYYFYIELEGRIGEATELLKELEENCRSVKVIGSYNKID